MTQNLIWQMGWVHRTRPATVSAFCGVAIAHSHTTVHHTGMGTASSRTQWIEVIQSSLFLKVGTSHLQTRQPQRRREKTHRGLSRNGATYVLRRLSMNETRGDPDCGA